MEHYLGYASMEFFVLFFPRPSFKICKNISIAIFLRFSILVQTVLLYLIHGTTAFLAEAMGFFPLLNFLNLSLCTTHSNIN